MVSRTKVKIREVMGERAVGKVAMAEIGELRIIVVGIKRQIGCLRIDLLSDSVCTRKILHDLGLKETPQKRKVEDRAAVCVRKSLEARRLCF